MKTQSCKALIFLTEMNHIPRLSEAVYIGMCLEVGVPTQVKIRREIADVEDVLRKPVFILHGLEGMTSGSRREGFRFKSSDNDAMLWFPDHKLISDLSQITLYRTPQHTVILMEWDGVTPGFTRLKMMTPTSHQEIKEACIIIDNEIYISSTRMRPKLIIESNTQPILSQHGPCVCFNFRGRDNDVAFCFQSRHWPKVALPWIQRCRLKQWPPECVLSAIIKEGCHVVPISSMPFRDERESEWRISFSRSEQILVYSMNHCQFLCYGLLKIFLKEVINADESNQCLCSYFMKTLVFWVVQSNSSQQWFPGELLNSFWACFKLLVSWVYKGVCPNFFIPENNMFRVKVTGNTQVALFEQLYDLYCKGISCLLLSPTIGNYLRLVIMDRSLKLVLNVSEAKLDSCLFSETNIKVYCFRNEKEIVLLLNLTEHLLKTRLTLIQAATVERYHFESIRNFSWHMLNQNLAALSNRERLYKYKKAINMMKLASRLSSSSEILYLALFYYRVYAYEKSLRCLQIAENYWSLQYLVYNGRHSNEEMYSHRVAGMSLIDKMRKVRIENITLYNDYAYIAELELEQAVNCSDSLSIPPFVVLAMLSFLNHHRLGDRSGSQQSLQDFQNMLLYDNGTQVPVDFRDISWQILGICQQIYGDYVGALDSFRFSLQENPFHGLQQATMSRIQTINDMHIFNG